MTMSTDRLNELRTFDADASTPQQRQDAVLELTAEVQRCWARIAELEKDSDFLNRLHAAGVDNWDGYHFGFGNEDDDE
jgi:hypothetical protein